MKTLFVVFCFFVCFFVFLLSCENQNIDSANIQSNFEENFEEIQRYCWSIRLEKAASNSEWTFLGKIDTGGIRSETIYVDGQTKEEVIEKALIEASRIEANRIEATSQ